ncbi:B- and T-lymphocyte attenuator isoform X2 [Castor canadensis]|uniref:B- and T-lymphocyte attenuator isoform X2 n=1 Tax=Castor canadensis TaxID=51338 RepID=A0AC58MIJ1_CASCN
MQGMKPSPAMLGTGKIFWVLFLIPHLGLCSNHGEEPCEVQLHVKRHLEHVVSVGKPFRMECPVKYCASRPNVTWCKLNGTECLDLGDRHHLHTSWEERKSISIFILHFEPVFPSDNGSYRCSAQFTSHVVTSHSIIIHVIEHAQNNSEFPLTNATSASGPPFEKETTDSQWLLLHLLPLMALPLLIIACYCLIYGLKRYQGKQKKPSDIAGREINLSVAGELQVWSTMFILTKFNVEMSHLWGREPG